jgi:hypothetical protein
LLRALASTVILGSESRKTHDHTLLSHDSGSLAAPRPNSCSFQDHLCVWKWSGSLSDGIIFFLGVFVAAEKCLLCRCLARGFSSGSDILTFRRHVTIEINCLLCHSLDEDCQIVLYIAVHCALCLNISEDASSSDGDAHHYVTIRKLLDCIFNTL